MQINQHERNKNLVLVKEKVSKHGFICTTTSYSSYKNKISLQCSEGHTFTRIMRTLQNNDELYCPYCVRSFTLKEVKKITSKYDMTCISTEYVNNKSKLTFTCVEGHVLTRTLNNLRKRGLCCSKCNKNVTKKNSVSLINQDENNLSQNNRIKSLLPVLEKMSKEGIVCLSTSYNGDRSLLFFKCSNGHTFSTTSRGLKESKIKTKCPDCVKSLCLKTIKELAICYKMTCISIKYINSSSILNFKCSNGHLVTRTYQQVRKLGLNCLICCNDEYLNEVNIIAKTKDMICLSAKYQSYSSHLKFNCSEGHIFSTTFNNLKNNGLNCPDCANKTILERIGTLAKKQNYKCISKNYLSSSHNLVFQCPKQHIFTSKLHNIRLSTLKCPVCTKNSYLIVAKKIALKHGGECYSTKYVSSKDKLLFRCSNGHNWKSSFNNLKSGTWCPICYHNKKRLSLECAKELAEKKNGKCLSKIYKNSSFKLKWICEKKHVWESTLNNIKNQNSWCPYCAAYKNEQECREIIQKITQKPFPTCKPSFLGKKNKKCLQLDGYNEELKIAFEYNGEQHYKVVDFFFKNGEKDLIKQKKRDEIKKQLCKKNNINLIIIPYWDKKNKYEIIKNKLEEFGFYKQHGGSVAGDT